MKLLIIDDEPDIRRIAHLSLARLGGMEVIEAGSGAEGVRKAEQELPDGILLDVMMPEMDGPATLAALRANPATAGIPVLFLTAASVRSERDRLRDLGAAAVLAKPFNPVALPDLVRQALEGHAAPQ
jgi:CheY-like chemotaxis protein